MSQCITLRRTGLALILAFSWPLPAAALLLTGQEQQFLQQHGPIRLCTDPDWLPYDGIDEQGRHIGVMSDFHALWSAKVGVPIQLVQTDSWAESLQYVENRQCDILSSAQDLPERQHYLRVTQPFIHYNFAVASQPDNHFIINLEQVLDRRFVMVEGYAGVEMLRRAYPEIDITTMATPYQGLRKVERGKYFGYIDTVPSINYQMLRHGISHLKITGVLDYHYAMSVGVHKDLSELLSIFNKAIAATSETERQRILNNWLSVEYAPVGDYRLYGWLLAATLSLLALLTYRYRRVHNNNQDLAAANQHLQQLSQQDQLTRLANRHGLHQAFRQEIGRVERGVPAFSLLLIDIDYFKRINDRYGHDAGDLIIQQFAGLLSQMVRQQDKVGRWGGEEFMIICPETALAGAMQLAEHLRSSIQQQLFAPNGRLSISVGIAQYRTGEPIESCIKRADKALYTAKHQGRNRCVSADP